MVKVVKVTRKVSRGHVSYSVNIPKALFESLGAPQEVSVRLEIKDEKPLIVLEPIFKPGGDRMR